MAYGSNDKRGTNSNNNSTHHENHTGNNQIVNVSNTSLTTTISLPSNPRPTPNRFPQTVQSFNNCEDGLQDFSHAKIESPAIGDSFNNIGSGSQTFKGAQINCAEKSSKQTKSIFPWKRDHVAHYGTLHSFNNKGKGSQSFDGFKLN